MKPFDLNIHLPAMAASADSRIHSETTMEGDSLVSSLDDYTPALSQWTNGGNFMLFNERLLPEHAGYFAEEAKTRVPNARTTVLCNFRAPSERERLEQMKRRGIDAVKFHSYVQKIEQSDFPKVAEIAAVAEGLGMPVFIDTSYGTADLYRYDNLRLAAFLLAIIKRTPIVLLHSGGARAMEAFLLADACHNVFLETSFTLNFFAASTIENDLAFAYKRLGTNRVAFGSDAPYVSFSDAMSRFNDFLAKHEFADDDRINMAERTAQRIFCWHDSRAER